MHDLTLLMIRRLLESPSYQSSSNRRIKRYRRARLPRILLIRRNIVIQLLRLIRKLGSYVITLGLLGLELNNGRHQLEDLVLYLAVLFIASVIQPYPNAREGGRKKSSVEYGMSIHLSSSSSSPCRSFDSRVESFFFRVVGNLVDFVQKVEISLGDAGEVVQVECRECGGGFFLGVSSLAARNGDIIERGCFEDTGLAGLQRCRERNGERGEGQNGE
jgi:hypothetical protein